MEDDHVLGVEVRAERVGLQDHLELLEQVERVLRRRDVLEGRVDRHLQRRLEDRLVRVEDLVLGVEAVVVVDVEHVARALLQRPHVLVEALDEHLHLVDVVRLEQLELLDRAEDADELVDALGEEVEVAEDLELLEVELLAARVLRLEIIHSLEELVVVRLVENDARLQVLDELAQRLGLIGEVPDLSLLRRVDRVLARQDHLVRHLEEQRGHAVARRVVAGDGVHHLDVVDQRRQSREDLTRRAEVQHVEELLERAQVLDVLLGLVDGLGQVRVDLLPALHDGRRLGVAQRLDRARALHRLELLLDQVEARQALLPLLELVARAGVLVRRLDVVEGRVVHGAVDGADPCLDRGLQRPQRARVGAARALGRRRLRQAGEDLVVDLLQLDALVRRLLQVLQLLGVARQVRQEDVALGLGVLAPLLHARQHGPVDLVEQLTVALDDVRLERAHEGVLDDLRRVARRDGLARVGARDEDAAARDVQLGGGHGVDVLEHLVQAALVGLVREEQRVGARALQEGRQLRRHVGAVAEAVGVRGRELVRQRRVADGEEVLDAVEQVLVAEVLLAVVGLRGRGSAGRVRDCGGSGRGRGGGGGWRDGVRRRGSVSSRSAHCVLLLMDVVVGSVASVVARCVCVACACRFACSGVHVSKDGSECFFFQGCCFLVVGVGVASRRRKCVCPLRVAKDVDGERAEKVKTKSEKTSVSGVRRIEASNEIIVKLRFGRPATRAVQQPTTHLVIQQQ